MTQKLVRGPMLNPRPDGSVEFFPDGALLGDKTIAFVGAWDALKSQISSDELPVFHADGLILPPFLDCHTHIPQFPLRGNFTAGIGENPPEGRLLAGLNRNVFPEEARASDTEYATRVVERFERDTRAQGVVGGAAFMTVHGGATRAALAILPDFWSVGLVLMNQNCPLYLRTDENFWERDIEKMSEDFGRRLIVTDRFAVSVDTPLRKKAVAWAKNLNLRMQTHLNEQRSEKAFVENVLYPNYASYADVYNQDGLLARDAILAHCIQMTPEEWKMVADAGAVVAHCPTSNTLLGSGTMPLDELKKHALPYAICTDVGASPTTSLLAEMAQFLTVHAGRSRFATPAEALWRVTLGPAKILGLDDQIGSFDAGKPLSYLVADADVSNLAEQTSDKIIAQNLLGLPSAAPHQSALDRLAAGGLDFGDDLADLTADVHAEAARLTNRIQRVVLSGEIIWRRQNQRF